MKKMKRRLRGPPLGDCFLVQTKGAFVSIPVTDLWSIMLPTENAISGKKENL